MTMVAVPHRTTGWLLRIAKHTGGRSHLVRVGLVSLTLSVLAAVLCALLAPGSHEVLTDFGDLPAWPQDEVRIAAEVWFTLAMAVVAILTTILWWRPLRPRRAAAANQDRTGQGAVDQDRAGPDAVEQARGPIGLGIATAAALVQTGIAMLAWQGTVALRDFADPGAVGDDRIAAPILSSTTALWVAALGAVLTYLVLVILAPTSALTTRPPASDLNSGAQD